VFMQAIFATLTLASGLTTMSIAPELEPPGAPEPTPDPAPELPEATPEPEPAAGPEELEGKPELAPWPWSIPEFPPLFEPDATAPEPAPLPVPDPPFDACPPFDEVPPLLLPLPAGVPLSSLLQDTAASIAPVVNTANGDHARERRRRVIQWSCWSMCVVSLGRSRRAFAKVVLRRSKKAQARASPMPRRLRRDSTIGRVLGGKTAHAFVRAPLALGEESRPQAPARHSTSRSRRTDLVSWPRRFG